MKTPHIPHQQYKDAMLGEVGKRFLSEFFAKQRPWHHLGNRPDRYVKYIPLPEFPYSIPRETKDCLGRPTASTRRMDMVLFVASGKEAAYHQDCFTVGVEMKGYWDDLQRDQKIRYYMGKTDYMYLAVPDYLIRYALIKAASIKGLGVFSLSSGIIIREAVRQDADPVIKAQMLLRALFGQDSALEFLIEPEYFEGIPCPTPRVDAGSQAENARPSPQEDKPTHKPQKTMNFVGNRTSEAVRRTRLELKNGKFCLWQGKDQPPLEFDFAEGTLTGIEIRRCNTSRGEMTYCDAHFVRDDESFDISTIASSSVTADLIGKLWKVKDPVNAILRIDAWQSKQYTNVNVCENGVPIGFLQLPSVRKVDKGFKVEHDTSERDAAVMGLIEQINARLRVGHARPQEGGGQGVSFAGPDEF